MGPMGATDRDRRRIDREVEHGRRIAAHADDVWGWETAAGRRRRDRRVRMLAAAAALGPRATVLELGSGTGGFTAELAGQTGRLVGVEVSADLLAKARARGSSAVYVRAIAEQLPFRQRTFDAVVGSSVLHHVDVGAALLEIRRVLRRGGRIAFTEPNFLNPQIAIQKTVPPVKRWLGDSPDETAFVAWRISARLRRAGFTDVHAEPFDFVHPLLPAATVGLAERLGSVFERVPLLREIAGSLLITAMVP